jgi:nitrogen regulatory protein PII
MKPCKRIEVVIEEPMAPKLVKLLQEHGTGAYTCIHNIGGHGDRGTRRADELAGDSSNTLFIIACESGEAMESIVELIRPLIMRSGGVCLVSDAMWLLH